LLLRRDTEVSNIASGFIYNSPSQGKVRVDEAFELTFASSLFDYSNITQTGVANQLWSLSPAITSPPQCFQDYVNPAFPLITDDLLVANNAIYAGMTYDSFAGDVALVSSADFLPELKENSHLTDRASYSGNSSTKAPSR
jgi:hypothetical protein